MIKDFFKALTSEKQVNFRQMLQDSLNMPNKKDILVEDDGISEFVPVLFRRSKLPNL